MIVQRLIVIAALAMTSGCLLFGRAAAQQSAIGLDESEPPGLAAIVESAFLTVHEGWSTDEVLLQDGLNRRFVEACQQRSQSVTAAECNWQLLTLRKAGKLSYEVTRRRSDRHDAYRHAAEIAARWVEDKFGVNTDRALCDPKIRAQFDAKARSISPNTDAYLLRKAALGLRKARRLRPEYVARVTDWGREISEHPVADLRQHLELVPESPGVYLFRDSSGYLYIGEAADLRQRLRQHLDRSDRTALANYLEQEDADLDQVIVEIHAFDPASDGKRVGHRRAYESDLISRRSPRFNVRP